MNRTSLSRALPLGLLLTLALPALALADGATQAAAESKAGLPLATGLNSLWVIVAAVLVMFMQAGFAFLEIGFSRGKNAGTVVAKILTNFSISALMYWAVGFALAFGVGGSFAGTHGWFVNGFNASSDFLLAYPNTKPGVTVETLFFFQFVFGAISLAIVWGTTLERVKFGVYIIYGVVFSAVIYPIVSHWIFGGGWLATKFQMQDFAGSTVVHLIGATGALAALLHLGPRKGKFAADGTPRAIPGHNMPLFGLGILILWLGWFGFNPGSTLNAIDGRFPEVVVVTQLSAAAGVLAALATMWLKVRKFDIGMAGNGAIAALVAITAPSGYVEMWAAPIIGAVAGVIVVLGVLAIDKRLDDPVGALSSHGLAGIWGTISTGIFASPRLAAHNAVGDAGLWYTGSFKQLGGQTVGVLAAFTFVFVISWVTFWVIKKTYGMRVTEEEEDAGLDISEHGMYGYPEQFIPPAELVGYSGGPYKTIPPAPVTASTAREATA